MRHQFMIDEWVTMLILLGAHGCDMLECPQKLERVCVVADVDFTVEEGMDGFRCWSLSCSIQGSMLGMCWLWRPSTCSFWSTSIEDNGYSSESVIEYLQFWSTFSPATKRWIQQ